mgnify:CR=1 FL=1
MNFVDGRGEFADAMGIVPVGHRIAVHAGDRGEPVAQFVGEVFAQPSLL